MRSVEFSTDDERGGVKVLRRARADKLLHPAHMKVVVETMRTHTC